MIRSVEERLVKRLKEEQRSLRIEVGRNKNKIKELALEQMLSKRELSEINNLINSVRGRKPK